MNARTTGGIAVALLGLLMVLPLDLGAQGSYIERDGRTSQLERDSGRRGPVNAVRLHGEVGHSRHKGFVLDGQPLLFDELTTFFPGISDRTRARESSDLSGRPATVYGRRTAKGVLVSLMIFADEEPERTKLDLQLEPRPDMEQFKVPIEEIPGMGELTEGAPR